MTTMREAAKAYDDHYYNGKGAEMIKKTGVYVAGQDQELHDAYHIMSSGVASMMKNKCVEDCFQYLDDNGHAEKLLGIKAELLGGIYKEVFAKLLSSLYDDGELFWHVKGELGEMLSTAKSSMNNFLLNVECSHNGNIDDVRYSKVDAFDGILKSYNQYRQMIPLAFGGEERNFTSEARIGTFINDDEIRLHIEKAKDLFYRLKETHLECFKNGEVVCDKLLELDVNEFAIDNFTMAEKIKLRGANLGQVVGRER